MNLHSKHLKTLQSLFAKHTSIKEALLFGSRALGTQKESSDINIALKGDISPTLIAYLKEELEDSTLPYFCDIISYERAPQELKEHIDTYALPLYTKEEQWQEARLGDIAIFNPQLQIKKGSIAKKVSMDMLQPFQKKIYEHSQGVFNGGSKFQNGDTLMARITPCLENGKTAFVDFLENDEIAFGSTEFIVIREIEGISDRHYLYYLMRTEEIRSIAIQSMTGSSGRERVQLDALLEHKIMFPPLERQKEIAEILGSFDDKIDFLHRQNKTLESLAQTLFRHYFIDNAKEEWEEKQLSEFGKVICGKTPSKSNQSFYGGNYPFIKIPDMHGNIFVFSTTDTLTQEGADSQRNKILPPLSICVSCIATVGLVSMNAIEAQTNQQINSIIPHKPHYRYYLFLYLQSLYDELHALASGGTATLNLNTTDFSKIKIPMPSDEELLSFNNETEAIFSRIFENQKKSITLKNTQNLALQRLLDER